MFVNTSDKAGRSAAAAVPLIWPVATTSTLYDASPSFLPLI
jgi:hypothetical protein